MAITRRRNRRTAQTGPAAGPRVRLIESLDEWCAALAKAEASGRMLVVQFFQRQNWACTQMRQYYLKMSAEPPFKQVIFTEIEVEGAEPELLAECGITPGRTRIPLYQCIVDGEIAESYTGGVPADVAKMLQRQVAALKGRRGGLLPKLLAGAAAAAAVAGAVWWRWGGGGGGGGRDRDSELASLGQRIAATETRIQNCERVGRLKQAKMQRRLLEQLLAQRRRLEAQLQQRSGGGKAAAGGGGGGAAEAGPYDDLVAALAAPKPRRRYAVAYSDEED